MIRSLSWHEFIHKADLVITLGILKTTVSSVVRTTPMLLMLSTINALVAGNRAHSAIVTDRPDVTESSIVVPKGSWSLKTA
jgi:hypothetical protein